ncbi:hypothetical protein BJ508DRAFT_124372 [Ascobolus immersus RN42]|uniref:F-box domain-containing protein n=1 Tax=Ascobolus immersus RN42 TaxID=1160509 RepID=A0A3N4I478_ASCIM|nr:hypothetical protein BJ508DRAFT_124372 [Ascobolus immersus RN42]
MTLPETSNSQDPAAAVPEEPTASTLPDENLEEHPGPTIRDEIIASLVNETLIRSIGAAQASIGLSNEQAAKMDNLYLRCDILNRVTGLASRKVIPLEFRDGLLQPKPDAGPILEVGQDSQFGFTVLIGEPVEEGCSGDKRLPTTVSAPGKQDPTPLAELEKVFDTLVISNPPTSEASPFTKLPVEILHQIIGLVKDNNSIISIATTCRKLQAIAEGITFRELPVCIGCRVPDCHRSPEQLILAIGGHGRRSHVRSLKVSLAIRENDNSGLPDKDALQNEIRERYTSACIKLFDTMSELQKMGVILRKVNVKQDTPHWWTMGLHITPGKALKIDKYSFPEVQDLKWTNKVAVVDPQSMVRHLKPFPNLIKLKFQVYGQLEYPDHSLRKSARLGMRFLFISEQL